MKILARGIDETFRIGDEITVMVVDVVGMNVRIGVKAPTNVSVVRQELLEDKRVEGRDVGARPQVRPVQVTYKGRLRV